MKRWLAIALAVFSINGCTSGAGTANPAMDSSVPPDSAAQPDTGAPPPDADAPGAKINPEDVVLDDAGIAIYKVETLTDVEGQWARVEQFLVNSKLLDRPHTDAGEASDDPEKIFMVGDVGTFVYIGDTIDKGPENQKILRFLISLKTRYFSRVVLIMGNRDINKLRLLYELAPAALKLDDSNTEFDISHFRLKIWKSQFEAFTKDADGGAKVSVDEVPTLYTNGQNVDADKVIKAKFLLNMTMGCQPTFGLLRQELGPDHDIDVVRFLEGLPKEGGLIHSYLRLAKIIFYDKYTKTLFMHGGIADTNLGVVPSPVSSDVDITTNAELIAWTKALNAWAQDRITDYDNGDYDAGLPLVLYQEPAVLTSDAGITSWGPPNPESVVQVRPWGNNAQGAKDIVMISAALQRKLIGAGVSRLVFGHSPVGEVPVYMRGVDGFEEIAGDTSWSTAASNATITVTPSGVTIVGLYTQYAVNKDVIYQTPIYYDSDDGVVGTSTDAPDAGDGRVWALGRNQKNAGPRLFVFYRAKGSIFDQLYSIDVTIPAVDPAVE